MSDQFEVDPDELVEQLGEHQRLTGTEPKDESSGMSRRDLLVRGGAAAAAVSGVGALAGTASAAPAKKGAFTGTLRVITLGVEWPTPEVQKKAEADLGFKFALTVTDPVTMVQKAITAPETFDIFGGYNYQDIQMWSSHHLTAGRHQEDHGLAAAVQAVRVGQGPPRLERRDLRRRRRPVPGALPQAGHDRPAADEGRAEVEQGHRPVGDQRARPARPTGPMPRYIVGTPAHFNADSIGYNADVLKKLPNQVGWPELLNKKWKGRVALLKDPGIVMQDVGNALKAQGIFKPKDMGNMTPAEIDRVVKIATTYKKAGQFRAYWANFNESVNLMASKEVVVESMWSPAVALLVAQGDQREVRGPADGLPRLVQRAGHRGARRERPGQAAGLLRLPELDVRGLARRDDHAPGLLHRQRRPLLNWIKTKGAANPAGGIPFKADEYDFWYGGARAARDLPGITGKVGDIKKGSVRDGGSFAQRIGHYSSWNSYFTNNAYQIKRWNDFLSA